MHDGSQLDLTAQVARVKVKARPWKSIIALVLAIAAGVASGWARHGFRQFFVGSDVPRQLIAAGAALAFCVFASIATYGLSGKARDVLAPRAGTAHAAVVRYALVLIGAFTTLVITLDLLQVPVGQLVLGGALTSVFVGIAAQQALSNVFAGIVLLVARPFRVGDAIRLQAGALGGTLDGTVTEIGITYVRLAVNGSLMAVPNSQVLNAVVGPRPADEGTGSTAGADVTGTGLAGPEGPAAPSPASAGATLASDPAAPITANDKTPPQALGDPRAIGVPGGRPRKGPRPGKTETTPAPGRCRGRLESSGVPGGRPLGENRDDPRTVQVRGSSRVEAGATWSPPRREAHRGSSRTVFREGDIRCGPGDPSRTGQYILTPLGVSLFPRIPAVCRRAILVCARVAPGGLLVAVPVAVAGVIGIAGGVVTARVPVAGVPVVGAAIARAVGAAAGVAVTVRVARPVAVAVAVARPVAIRAAA
jgi:hypothetical protein